MTQRTATVSRDTLETQITVELNLDGVGNAEFTTGVPFLDHMMDQIARHGLIDLKVVAKGDRHIDDHHTVEDIGITLGQAVAAAIGDKKGIYRYGHAYVPLDEALSRAVIDFSGRPGLLLNCQFTRARVGHFDVDLFGEFSAVLSTMPESHCTWIICVVIIPTIRRKPCSRLSAERYVWRPRAMSVWRT